jgi:3-oxoacyl-[acyl-carrier-protein] synthase III
VTRGRRGVRIAGTGCYLPEKRLTNADLEKLMDTSDEWIVQRTGIHERRVADPAKGESTIYMATQAARRAIEDARLTPTDLDVVILATMTEESSCPANACRIADELGAGHIGAFDLNAACSGLVFATNIAHDLIAMGGYNTVCAIGCDTLSRLVEYTTHGRGTAVLFGDAASAVVLKATDDVEKGIIAQSMHCDGGRGKDLYVPMPDRDLPEDIEWEERDIGHALMNGSAVFKFAVKTFPDLIEETLSKAGLRAEDVDQFICHQSNARILKAARERFGLPEDKLYVNIDRVGNTSAASVGICFDELRRSGRITEGMRVMFVAFGAGLTWGSSLWQL